MKNKYYIVRTERAGVFFGQIKEKSKDSVVMTDVQKIHYWDGASAVEQIATDGVNDQSRLTVAIDEMEIDKWIQIIPCTQKSFDCLKSLQVWKR